MGIDRNYILYRGGINVSSNPVRKIKRRGKKERLAYYRAFCDFINKQKLPKRFLFAFHAIKGDL